MPRCQTLSDSSAASKAERCGDNDLRAVLPYFNCLDCQPSCTVPLREHSGVVFLCDLEKPGGPDFFSCLLFNVPCCQPPKFEPWDADGGTFSTFTESLAC